jgi:hypothetical protein
MDNSYFRTFSAKLGDAKLDVSNLTQMKAVYGPYMVVAYRTRDGGPDEPAEEGVLVAPLRLVSVGIFGGFCKVVPTSSAVNCLPKSEQALFANYQNMVVCSAPMDGNSVSAIVNMLLSAETYLATKAEQIGALDIVGALSCGPDTLSGALLAQLIAEIVRFIDDMGVAERERLRSGGCLASVAVDTVGELFGRTFALADESTHAAFVENYASTAEALKAVKPLGSDEMDALTSILHLLALNSRREHATNLLERAVVLRSFVPLCRKLHEISDEKLLALSWDKIVSPLLDNLVALEHSYAWERATAPTAHAAPSALLQDFVFTLGEVDDLSVPNAVSSTSCAFHRLNEFMGGYLGCLDLSHTLVAGPAIAASLIVTDAERNYTKLTQTLDGLGLAAGLQDGFSAYIDVHYPAVRTQSRGTNYKSLRRTLLTHRGAVEFGFDTSMNTNYETFLVLSAKLAPLDCELDASGPAHETTFDVRQLAHIRLVVSVDSISEFAAVARAHYLAVRSLHPTAVLLPLSAPVDSAIEKSGAYEHIYNAVRNPAADCRHGFVIFSNCPRTVHSFRSVLVVRGSFDSAIVAPNDMECGVYGCVGGLATSDPQFVVTARLLRAMDRLQSAGPSSYKVWAPSVPAPPSAKTRADSLSYPSSWLNLSVFDYLHRGFGVANFPKELQRVFLVSDGRDDRDVPVIPRYPALQAYASYSAYALPIEFYASRIDKC